MLKPFNKCLVTEVIQFINICFLIQLKFINVCVLPSRATFLPSISTRSSGSKVFAFAPIHKVHVGTIYPRIVVNADNIAISEGLIALTDARVEDGGFQCVPGFF